MSGRLARTARTAHLARHEPWGFLGVAVVLAAAAWSLPALDRTGFEAPAPAPTALHPALLASPVETADVGPEDWLTLAVERPASFAASRAFCRRHRTLPLPNCRNLLAAAQARAALPSPTPAPRGVAHVR